MNQYYTNKCTMESETVQSSPESPSKRQKCNNDTLPVLTLHFDNGHTRKLSTVDTKHVIAASPECIGAHFELDNDTDIEIPLNSLGCKSSHLDALIELICELQECTPNFKSIDDIKLTLNPDHDNIKLRALDLFHCQLENLLKQKCVVKCMNVMRKRLPDIIKIIKVCNVYNFTLAEKVLSYYVAFACIAGKSSTALAATMV